MVKKTVSGFYYSRFNSAGSGEISKRPDGQGIICDVFFNFLRVRVTSTRSHPIENVVFMSSNILKFELLIITIIMNHNNLVLLLESKTIHYDDADEFKFKYLNLNI